MTFSPGDPVVIVALAREGKVVEVRAAVREQLAAIPSVRQVRPHPSILA